jgi:hypothetical protein
MVLGLFYENNVVVESTPEGCTPEASVRWNTADEARAWFEENNPQRVAFEHEADQYGVPSATE